MRPARLAAIALALVLATPASAVVSSATSSSGPYTCNGSTTAFAVGFRFLDNTHLVVSRSDGVTLAVGTDYTVAGAGGTSGTVTLTAGSKCGSATTLTIKRVVPLTQTTPFSTQGSFSPKAHELAFDRQTMSAQQLDRTHSDDKASQATRDAAQDAKEATDVATIGNAVAALNGTSHSATDASSVLAFGSTTPRTLTARFAETYNVLDFGAKCDGATDDLAAIQAACDQARIVGGAVVQLPTGTCVVKPSTVTWLRIGTGVTLAGRGLGVSVLKVHPSSGNYPRLIANYPDGATSVSNVAIRDLRIDQNPTGNSGQDIYSDGAHPNQPATAIALGPAQGVTISNIAIDPMTGVNGVSVNGGSATSGVLIEGSRFRFVQGHTTQVPDVGHTEQKYYDHSAVYVNASDGRVIGNHMETATLADRGGAGFELHGGPGLTGTGNTVERYSFCAHVTSRSPSDAEIAANNISVTGNTCTDVGSGVMLWPLAPRGLHGITIANNVISINNATRAAYTVPAIAGPWPSGDGITAFSGISFHPTYAGPTDGVDVAGNIISFEPEATRGASYTASLVFGIGGTLPGSVTNLSVVRNIVRNAPATGIKVNASGGVRGLTIATNKVVNSGNDSTVPVSNYRSAVWLYGTHTDVHVEWNQIADTNASVAGVYSIYEGTAGTSTVYRGNTESTNSGAYKRQVNATAYDDAPQSGTNRWVSTVWPPTKLSVNAGDEVIYNPGGVAQPAVMSVTAPGTFGTLVGVTGDATIGSADFTLSDVSSLARGDWIFVSGGKAGAQIVSITGNVVTLSGAATGTVTGAAAGYVAPSVKHMVPLNYTLAFPGAGPFTISPDLWAPGSDFDTTVTSGTNLTVNNVLHATKGQRVRFRFINTFGAMGTYTWAAQYKTATGGTWAVGHDANPITARPAVGFNRTIEFEYDGTSWVEQWRSPVDVPN